MVSRLVKWWRLPVTGRLQYVKSQDEHLAFIRGPGAPWEHTHLQQRSERVLQPSLQQHQSSVPLRRPRWAKTGLISVAKAMAVAATSEVLGKCMITEIAYTCVFLFLRTMRVWHTLPVNAFSNSRRNQCQACRLVTTRWSV